MQIKGDISPNSILVLEGKKVNVLHNKPKEIIYTSMPNQITKFYT